MYCCKELYATFGMVPGSVSDEVLSQQPEVLLNNEPFTYILASVLKSGKRPLRYLVYNKCLCEFTFNLDCTAKAKPVAKPYKHVAGNMKDKQFIGHSF